MIDINKMSIIGAGLTKWENRLEEREDELEKWTDKLRKAHKNDTSIKRRRNLRIKRDNAAEEVREARKIVETGRQMKAELLKESD